MKINVGDKVKVTSTDVAYMHYLQEGMTGFVSRLETYDGHLFGYQVVPDSPLWDKRNGGLFCQLGTLTPFRLMIKVDKKGREYTWYGAE